MVFLILYFFGIFKERVLLAALMGESAVGLYYFFEKKFSEKYHFFRLPFLLSETWGIFLLLGNTQEIFSVLFFLSFLWILFGGIFIFRENKRVGRLVKKLVECCKNW